MCKNKKKVGVHSSKVKNRISFRISKNYHKKKYSLIKKKIRNLNPKFQYFNLDSVFIYESIQYEFFYSSLSDNNNMKPKPSDLEFLKAKIEDLQKIRDNEKNIKTINIPLIYANFFNNMEKKIILNQREKQVQTIVNEYDKNKVASCEKIAHIYKQTYDENISKSTVHRILKKKLNYCFRKTIIKTSKLESIISIKQTFFILNLIIHILKIGGELVYVDESGFYKSNGNLKMWRKSGQTIYYDIKDNIKLNLLLAVTQSKVLHYKIVNENIDSGKFEEFLGELCEKLTDDEKRKYIFFLDNCTAHNTAKLFEFYNKQKMKVIFNTPYRSNFNMVELVFRHIKRETYTHIYNTDKEIIAIIDDILREKGIGKKLTSFYKNTLDTYLNYIYSNKFVNLN